MFICKKVTLFQNRVPNVVELDVITRPQPLVAR